MNETAIPGQGLTLRTGWTKLKNQPDFRVVFFVANDTDVISAELPPGYDWYPPRRWKKKTEVVEGVHTIHLPDDLPTGRYDLGFAVFDPQGAREVVETPMNATAKNPRYSHQEIRWIDAVEVVNEDEGLMRAQRRLEAAQTLAQQGACQAARDKWQQARRVVLPDHPWSGPARLSVERALAVCWASAAVQTQSPSHSLTLIKRARALHHRDPTVLKHGQTLARRHLVWANAAREDGESAIEGLHLRVVLAADPTRSWLRRRAETLRDKRLGLTP